MKALYEASCMETGVRVGSVVTGIRRFVLGVLNLARGRGHALHFLAVTVVAGNLDGGVRQLVLQVHAWGEDDATA